jgi:hypothetical protein
MIRSMVLGNTTGEMELLMKENFKMTLSMVKG